VILVLAITITVGIIGFVNIKKMDALDTELYKVNAAPLGQLCGATTAFQRIRINLRDVVLATSPEMAQEKKSLINDLHTKLDAELTAFEKTIKSDEVRKLFDTLETKMDEYDKISDETIAFGMAGKRAQAVSVMFVKGVAITKEVNELFDELVKIKVEQAKAKSDFNTAVACGAIRWMVICIVLGVILAGIFATFVISDVTRTLRILQDETQRLTEASLDGRLSERADVGKVNFEFQPIVEGFNRVLEALVQPLRVTAQYVDRIAAGDIPPTITDEYKGEFNQIKQNLNRCIATLNSLIAGMNHMASEHNAGDIDVTIPADQFEGAYRTMAEGTNGMVNGHIAVKKKAMACIAEFGRGNFDAPLEQFPGKKAFINETIEAVRTHLRALITDADGLVQAALAGQLSTRADATKHAGDFRRIVEGINATLDAVIGPMTEASDVLALLANKDLSARVQGDYAGDLATIKNNLNQALDALEATVLEITGIAEQVADAAAQVASAAENVGQSSQEVAGGAQQVAGGAAEQTRSATDAATNMEQLQRAIEEVARGAQAQASGAEQAAHAAQEALSGVREIVSSAEAARQDAQQAGSVAQQGAQIVGDTVSGMGRMRTAAADSSARVTALSESSQRIGEIVEAINDIAEQTNLLALNAAIEAARAGEHGKGFAVVADEVRKLAERSATQTKEIAALIRGIQDGIAAAVNSMAVAGQEVEAGATLAGQAGQALQEILAAADKVVAQAAGVAERARGVEGNAAQVLSAAENVSSASEESTAATEEMAASSTEVTRAIEHVAAVTEQSSATSEELSAAAEEATALVEEMSAASKELADLADRTRVLLATFTVSGAETSSSRPSAKAGGNGKVGGNGTLKVGSNGTAKKSRTLVGV
jgi:methyl-accepting chemotaxis protein